MIQRILALNTLIISLIVALLINLIKCLNLGVEILVWLHYRTINFISIMNLFTFVWNFLMFIFVATATAAVFRFVCILLASMMWMLMLVFLDFSSFFSLSVRVLNWILVWRIILILIKLTVHLICRYLISISSYVLLLWISVFVHILVRPTIWIIIIIKACNLVLLLSSCIILLLKIVGSCTSLKYCVLLVVLWVSHNSRSMMIELHWLIKCPHKSSSNLLNGIIVLLLHCYDLCFFFICIISDSVEQWSIC